MSAKVMKGPLLLTSEQDAAAVTALRSATDDAFEAGRQQGRLEATQEVEQHLAQLNEILRSTTEAVAAQVAQAARLDADVMTALAADLAAWFIGAAVESTPAVLADGIGAAMATLADEGRLVLSVSPAVAETLGRELSLDSVTVRPDPEMGPADFALATDGTVIERRWAEAIDDLAPAISDALRLAGTGGSADANN